MKRRRRTILVVFFFLCWGWCWGKKCLMGWLSSDVKELKEKEKKVFRCKKIQNVYKMGGWIGRLGSLELFWIYWWIILMNFCETKSYIHFRVYFWVVWLQILSYTMMRSGVYPMVLGVPYAPRGTLWVYHAANTLTARKIFLNGLFELF